MLDVYVVLCHEDGCEECNPRTHVVGVFIDLKLAKIYAEDHEENPQKDHYHYYWTEVVKDVIYEIGDKDV